jgi:hypothetical protein
MTMLLEKKDDELDYISIASPELGSLSTTPSNLA